MKKFFPKHGHIKVLPKEITAVAKKVTREDGTEVDLVMGDRSIDEKKKAVNQGTINETASNDADYCKGAEVVYYPFAANDFIEDEIKYHIIHERDVLGHIIEVS